jgi:hypothetical protein|tara:strand:- start:1019 stop:1459 length:441 start_codon:yes stop_codon:yes gene_type:complete
MEKCNNFVCLNMVKGGNKEYEQFCHSCVISVNPYVFLCIICKTTFTHMGRGNHKTGRPSGCLPNCCSTKCKEIKHSLYCKNKYRKSHPIKTKKCPTCKKGFKKAGSKYCSSRCYPSKISVIRERNRKIKRSYKKMLKMLSTHPYLT